MKKQKKSLSKGMGCNQSVQVKPQSKNPKVQGNFPKINPKVQQQKAQIKKDDQNVRSQHSKQFKQKSQQILIKEAKVVKVEQSKNSEITEKAIQVKTENIKNKNQVKQQFGNDKQELPMIEEMIFKAGDQKLLPGKYSAERTAKDQNGVSINANDCFGNIGVLSLWYQNFCYVDGKYNNTDYKVERGSLAGWEAYRVHPPNGKAQKFLGSRHCLVFKINEQQIHTIYKFEDNSLEVAGRIDTKDIKANGWAIVSTIQVSEIGKPFVILVLPADQEFSPFTKLSHKVQGGTVFKDESIRIQLIKTTMDVKQIGNVNPMIPQDFPHGPNSHENCYNPNRDFFYIFKDNKDYIVWADNAKKHLMLTQIDRKSTSQQTIRLQGKTPDYQFAAACGDQFNVYFIQCQGGQSEKKSQNRKMYFVKCDYQGKMHQREQILTDKPNFDVFHFDTMNLLLNQKDGTIAMYLSRKLTVSTDGLNHQSGWAAVFDSKTLKCLKKFGQTSGHSFANSIVLNSKQGKGFYGVDLGDNYPRSVHLWKFNQQSIKFKQVYSFKTLHGDKQKSPAGVSYPFYDQISKGGKKFYKWSNDNKTYTQLAAPGIVNHQTGNIVIFAGQNKGGSLNNAITGDYNNCPRNIGFVKCSQDLEKVLSQGKQESGGFFTFGGKWSQLKNTGIKFLTNLQDGQNASRVKTAEVNKQILILFQIWSKDSYKSTNYMLIDMDGNILVKHKSIPFKIRLHKSDDIFVNKFEDGKRNSVLVFSGGKGKVINRFQIFVC